ncbi:MAG: hypothetical protein A2030_11570 [Chloroflexi bacterium RBG_19FT_COMBO_50_10]|nr:MAG: hypothetical protein A2030_11570 [Chloroflexi bacterium RBG_19FT_COMBO_50_10]
MNMLRILYHLMRTDFLERSRRYSFLITLVATIIAAYLYMPPSSADYLTLGLGNYRGVYNSAWVGGAVAVLCSALLSLPAFYLVKNAIERDEQTRVGQIIATTPLSKPLYTLGKAFSNFVFLAVMVGGIALSAGAMQMIRGEVFRIDLWALLSPFVYCVLPVMALIAAVAILFETISWLRGTLGNVVYFILWLVLLIVSAANMSSPQQAVEPANDLWGIQIILSSMMNDTAAAFPDYQGSVAIGAVTLQAPLQTFTWNGIHWTSEIIFGRMMWMGAAQGISLLAALFFRRFDPAPQKLKPRRNMEPTESFPLDNIQSAPVPAPVHLTPLALGQHAFYPFRILLAELRLLFKGIRWWWLIVIFGLNMAGFLLPTDSARQYVLPVAWILPLPLWSSLGTREKHHNTDQLVYSAPHPLRRQFPLIWLAGVIVTLISGAGVAVNLMLAGDGLHLLAWGIGALFIPTLALVLGVWSGSNKLFEVVYMLLWYSGPVNRIESLDFMGASSNIPLDRVLLYGLFTILLFAFAVVGRNRQLKR